MKSVYRTPMRYFDLLEAFTQPGCALCRLLLRGVEQFVDSLLYEYTNSDEMRAAFASSKGVCSEHGHLLRYNKQGNVLAIAKLYQFVLDDVLGTLDATVGEAEPPSLFDRLLGSSTPRVNNAHLADQLEPKNTCIVCDVMMTYEKDFIEIIRRYAGEERFQDAFRGSDGMCLPHFRQIVRALTSLSDAQAVISIQKAIWQELRDDLALFIEKQNYEHIGEPMGREGDSWVRAIARMAGEKGVFGVRRS